MKANGKNLRMFTFTVLEYMDEQPDIYLRTAPSREAITEYIEELQSRISGNISEAIEMSPKDFYIARNSNYWKGMENILDALAEDCSEKWVIEYDKLINNKN